MGQFTRDQPREEMRGKHNLIFLVICLAKYCKSVEEIDYEYIEEPDQDANRRFFLGGNDEAHDELEHHEFREPSQYQYDDKLPFGKLSDKETLTIEQFVNELKRRKEAKAKQKKKQLSKVSVNKNSKNKKNPKKVKSNSSVNKKSKPQKEKSTSTNPRKSKTKQRPNSGRKTKPSKSVGGNSPKKDNKHNIKDSEEEDSFQIGNSNADQHSDHHIHHHDHLEAHKHHHKHKESHSHAHDHAN